MRTLVFLAVATVLLLLQSALHTLVPITAPLPALAVLAPLYAALSPGWALRRAVIVAFLIGYLFDLMSGTPLGVHALAVPLVVLVGSLLGTRVRVRGPASRAVTVAVLTLIFGTIVLGTSRLGAAPAPGGLRAFLLEALMTAVVTPPVFALLDRNERRFDRAAVHLGRPSGQRFDTGIELRR